MKLISVNVGLPREVSANGQRVLTGIFKQPVAGRIAVRRLNLDGDRQADLSVHGGPDKAVYAYPAEHYTFWRRELPEMELPFGMFGENLSVEGLREDEVNVGDRFAIGTAEFQATQPRLPCYKLGIKFGRADMVKRFLHSRCTGFYFRVVKEGEVEAGDAIALVHRDPGNVTVADITRLYAFDRNNAALLHRVLDLPALPEDWRAYFREKAAAPAG
ncbi:MAG: MOSC domain-containing protein [Candidatus Acidiferrales bacterium]